MTLRLFFFLAFFKDLFFLIKNVFLKKVMAFLLLPLVLEKVIEAIVIAGAAAATAVVVNEVVETTAEAVGRATSSSSSSTTTTTATKETEIFREWWGNNLTAEEQEIFIKEIGINPLLACFNFEHLKNKIDEYHLAKAPGKPTKEDGYEPPKNWDGKPKRVPNDKSKEKGYPHKDGSVWVPTGPKGHGGSHWDVEYPDGSYKNVRPKKK
jgi:hypothetical protein